MLKAVNVSVSAFICVNVNVHLFVCLFVCFACLGKSLNTFVTHVSFFPDYQCFICVASVVSSFITLLVCFSFLKMQMEMRKWMNQQ